MNSFDPTGYTVSEIIRLSDKNPNIWAEIDTWVIEQRDKLKYPRLFVETFIDDKVVSNDQA